MLELSWVKEEFQNLFINDGRIINRAVRLVSALFMSPGKSIPQACGNWKETKAAYRLLDNKKVSTNMIIQSHKTQTITRIVNENYPCSTGYNGVKLYDT